MDGMSTPPQGGGVVKHPSIHPATHHLSAAPLAALTRPTAACPLLKGEWMMVMVMMYLHKQQASVA